MYIKSKFMRQETITVQKIDGHGRAWEEEMPIKVWESIGEEKNTMGWQPVAHAPREVVELKSKNAQTTESKIEQPTEVVGATTQPESVEVKQKRAYNKK